MIALLASLTACGHPKSRDLAPTQGASVPSGPAPSGPATPPSTPPSGPPSSAVVVEFTVDGAGPYQLGAMLADLQASPGLADVTKGGQTCPNNTTAQGTGVWKDVHLSFHPDGTLYLAENRSPSIPTPSGAWLGTTLAQLKTIYAHVQSEVLTKGTAQAFLVTTISGGAILFDLNAKGVVISMATADADFLRTSYQGGTDFC